MNLSASPRRPAGPSRASGWSSLTTPWGLPCCLRFPCVHAVATTPAQRLGGLRRSFTPAVSAFPERVVGSACASSFSRLARRSLALRPAHSRCHRISWHANQRLQPLRYLHDCSGCFRLERLPGGTFTHWKAPPFHGAHPEPSSTVQLFCVARSYSITSSARTSSVSGNVRPSDLAVFMLMTSCILVISCTGKS